MPARRSTKWCRRCSPTTVSRGEARFKKLPALARVGDRAVTLMAEGDTLRSSTVSIGPGSSPSLRPTPSPISSRIDSRRWAWR